MNRPLNESKQLCSPVTHDRLGAPTSTVPQTLDIHAIQQLIPHRYPFLFVDRIEQMVLGESAVGIKNVSMNEWFFQGHFPNHPVVPGVLVVEAMAQTAGVLVMQTLHTTGQADALGTHPVVYFMSVENAKFRKPVCPGDTLELHVSKEQSRGTIWKFRGRALVQQALVGEAIFTAMIRESK